jgi:hypothetical protein
MRATSQTYAYGPFSLTSSIPLPELPLSTSAGLPVSITIGKVPSAIAHPTFSNPAFTASQSELLMQIAGVASYYIQAGSTVIVEPASESDDLDIRGYLLGTAFAVLCHQRRLLPLHACAVRMGNGTVAFLGDSGAGKSTLAAFLVERGFPLVADDVCLLDPDAELAARVIPVAPWLKLWRTSLDALGRSEDGLNRTFNDEEKFRVPIESVDQAAEQRLPLSALVILKRAADPGSQPALTPVRAAQSVVESMRFTYQQYLLEWLGLQEDHFRRTSLAIAGAKVYVFNRPWGFQEFESVLSVLVHQFCEPA